MEILVSFGLLLSLGWSLGKLAERVMLPSLVGMLAAGIILGPSVFDLMNEGLLTLAPQLRALALVIILLRAGLALELADLKQIRGSALALSLLPCLFEGFAVLFAARLFLSLTWFEGGMLGFTLAAVSPAVVVPAMLSLHTQGYGRAKQIPSLVLAGATLDDVFAVSFFGVFLLTAMGQDFSLSTSLFQLPWQIGAGLTGGIAWGLILSFFLKKLQLQSIEKVALTLVLAVFFVELSNHLSFAGFLGVVAMGMTLQVRERKLAHEIQSQLGVLWLIAQIALFSLLGTEVNLGAAAALGALSILIIVIGLVARSGGVLLALRGSNLNWREKLFCIFAYLPKATVQAAIGGIPLAYGLEAGEPILAISALAILLTAPLGAIAINQSAPRLLEKSSMV